MQISGTDIMSSRLHVSKVCDTKCQITTVWALEQKQTAKYSKFFCVPYNLG